MTVTRLLLATRSHDKLREIGAILDDAAHIELLTLDAAGVRPSDEEEAIEAFDSFHENALAKARFFMAMTGLPTLADDSGIVVDALDGAPGVRSKRFASDEGVAVLHGGTDEANNSLLLTKLAGVPEPRRTARYICAAALARPNGGALVSLGCVEGRILDARRGTGGFGYDPLFAPAGSSRSFGEWSAGEKNRISHRARAFRALATAARDFLARA